METLGIDPDVAMSYPEGVGVDQPPDVQQSPCPRSDGMNDVVRSIWYN